MKSLGILAGLLVAAVVVATALAQPQESDQITYQAVSLSPTARDPAVRVTASTKLAPLELPDIAALSKAAWKADRSTLKDQLRSSMNVIRFWHGKGAWLRAPRHAKCWDVPWQRSCTVARASLRLHSTLASIAQTRLTSELPLTNDWRTAVRLTQRVFPGTEDWLLFISHREGGYGPFVMNHQGSGAGGWMQFMAGTFYGYVDAARASVESRGFIVDPLIWEWTNPMGQALTAGFMKWSHREGCHWCL